MTPKKKRKTKDGVVGRLVELIQDGRQLRAATILAYNGYRKGSGRKSGALTAAARAAEVDIQTIYAWLREPNFRNAISEVQAQLVGVYLDGIRNSAAKGNVAASIYGLKLIDPIFDDALQRELTVLRAKNEQLSDLLEKHPIPTLTVIASADVPPPPKELEPYLH